MPDATAFPDILRVRPSGPVSGSVSVPGGKSAGNRALLLAGFAAGVSRLRGLPDADDADAALGALAALGIRCRREDGVTTVEGSDGVPPLREGDVDIRSSGTVGRFLPGLLAAARGGEWRLVATPQLSARPIAPLVDALGQWGADIRLPGDGRSFPLVVRGGGLAGGEAVVSARASSQFASGLLMAAPLCARPARVRIADLDPGEAYIDITLDLMRAFGVDAAVERRDEETIVDIASPLPYRGLDLTIGADANTAMYFLALAALTGGEVAVPNLDAASRQPGLKFLDVLRRLGADIRSGPGVAVAGRRQPLRGGFSIDMRAMSEMALTLGVMAVFADAPVTMTNLAHIRGHESDRLAALAELLARVGVRADETPDGVTVHPLPRAEIRNVDIDPHDDHRLAMSFALLGAAANGIGVRNPACVSKTCPGFFGLLEGIGVGVD